jgi:hypothetical protein
MATMATMAKPAMITPIEPALSPWEELAGVDKEALRLTVTKEVLVVAGVDVMAGASETVPFEQLGFWLAESVRWRIDLIGSWDHGSSKGARSLR